MSDFATVGGIFLFDTDPGRFALAWTERGVCGAMLPPADEARFVAGWAPLSATSEPPAVIRRLAGRVAGHLRGEHADFSHVSLDLFGVSPFRRAIYAALRTVAAGQTVTYGGLAGLAGRPAGASRGVGQAMAHNRIPLLIPCHRVVRAGGELGGFSSPRGVAQKLELLSMEGADLTRVTETGVATLRRADRRLGKVIRRVGEFNLAWQRRGDAFSALCETIVHQQVSMKAGATIFGRLRDLAGGEPVLSPEKILAASAEQLRGVGLSGQKTSYVLDLAHKTVDGSLPLDHLGGMADASVVRELTRVKGLGRWSAQMYLMFRLGRLDVLPVDDLGLQKGVQALLKLDRRPKPSELDDLCRAWAPFRSIATWYLWRAQDAGGL